MKPRRRKKSKKWGPRPAWLQKIVDAPIPPDYQAQLMQRHAEANRPSAALRWPPPFHLAARLMTLAANLDQAEQLRRAAPCD